jgi:hypothetical protein
VLLRLWLVCFKYFGKVILHEKKPDTIVFIDCVGLNLAHASHFAFEPSVLRFAVCSNEVWQRFVYVQLGQYEILHSILGLDTECIRIGFLSPSIEALARSQAHPIAAVTVEWSQTRIHEMMPDMALQCTCIAYSATCQIKVVMQNKQHIVLALF